MDPYTFATYAINSDDVTVMYQILNCHYNLET